MDELAKLLAQFRACMEFQIQIFTELVPVLDKEEELIFRFEMSEFEQVVIEKDQLVRRAGSAEERRVAHLRRVCALMGYDNRGQSPSLRDFLTIFSSYLENVKALITKEQHAGLSALFEQLQETARKYVALFAEVTPRVRRNQQVLKKMETNFSRSVALFESEARQSKNYNASGRTQAQFAVRHSLSSLRVKA